MEYKDFNEEQKENFIKEYKLDDYKVSKKDVIPHLFDCIVYTVNEDKKANINLLTFKAIELMKEKTKEIDSSVTTKRINYQKSYVEVDDDEFRKCKNIQLSIYVMLEDLDRTIALFDASTFIEKLFSKIIENNDINAQIEESDITLDRSKIKIENVLLYQQVNSHLIDCYRAPTPNGETLYSQYMKNENSERMTTINNVLKHFQAFYQKEWRLEKIKAFC